MGKGDKKSRKGKIAMGSYGNSRKKRKPKPRPQEAKNKTKKKG